MRTAAVVITAVAASADVVAVPFVSRASERSSGKLRRRRGRNDERASPDSSFNQNHSAAASLPPPA